MHFSTLYLATTLLAAASSVVASPLPGKTQGLETRDAASGPQPLRSSDIELDQHSSDIELSQRSSDIELDARSSDIELDARNLAKDLHLTVSDIEREQGAPRQKHHDGAEAKVLPLSSSG